MKKRTRVRTDLYRSGSDGSILDPIMTVSRSTMMRGSSTWSDIMPNDHRRQCYSKLCSGVDISRSSFVPDTVFSCVGAVLRLHLHPLSVCRPGSRNTAMGATDSIKMLPGCSFTHICNTSLVHTRSLSLCFLGSCIRYASQ